VRQRWQQFCLVDAQVAALLPGLQTVPYAGATAPMMPADLPRVPGYEVEAVLGRGGVGVGSKARPPALTPPLPPHGPPPATPGPPARRRPQEALRRHRGPAGRAGALPGGGRGRRPAPAPEHRPDPRSRRGGRTAVLRPGIRRGRFAGRAAGGAALAAARRGPTG